MKKLLSTLVVSFAMLVPGLAGAQDNDYPSRAIQIITPFAPGGSTDTSARIFASVLGNYLPHKVDVVVVNRPGGSTTIGMTATQNAAPDGYTIALSSNSPITIQPHFGRASYSWDSFAPVIKLVDIPQMLLVKKDAPWKTFKDWLAYVRKNPGDFTYSTPGNGSISDLAMAVLNEAADIKTRAIPYESGGRAIAAMLGGNVGGVATFQGNADPSQARALVNFSAKRSTKRPNVPTLKDVGFDAHKDAFIGIVAPKGVAPARIKILHDAFKKALKDPKVAEALRKQSFEISYEGPDAYAKTLKEDFEQNGRLLKRANLIK